MHVTLEHHPAEMAAARVLQSIAAKPGVLLQLLLELQLIDPPDAWETSMPMGFDMPPLDFDQRETMGSVLRSSLQAALKEASTFTGVPEERIVMPLIEQLRHVAMFATSDGGSTDVNVGAVEGMLRNGRVELFAAV